MEDEKHGYLCLRCFLAAGRIEYYGGDVDLDGCSRTSAGGSDDE
ncbi:hypothetical protein J2754_001588 [Halarchaeum solikamskense]|nr:hypothetical protein [Halarchaeum solikamskense]MBP2251267.1 hypothetical protein [Halarchaeum solikamskense]